MAHLLTAIQERLPAAGKSSLRLLLQYYLDRANADRQAPGLYVQIPEKMRQK